MNGHSTTAVGAITGFVVSFLLGGVFAQALGSALGLVAVITGLTTLAVRSYAALTSPREMKGDDLGRRLERATAAGAAAGFLLRVAALILDALIGG